MLWVTKIDVHYVSNNCDDKECICHVHICGIYNYGVYLTGWQICSAMCIIVCQFVFDLWVLCLWYILSLFFIILILNFDNSIQTGKIPKEILLPFLLYLSLGVTYIRWGRKSCPKGVDLVYTGILNNSIS